MIVYWIHLETHNDIMSQGYVGVTINLKQRLRAHRNMINALETELQQKVIVETVFEGASDECIQEEIRLRPEDEIGWNHERGGGLGKVGNKKSKKGQKAKGKLLLKGDKRTEAQKLAAKTKKKVSYPQI